MSSSREFPIGVIRNPLVKSIFDKGEDTPGIPIPPGKNDFLLMDGTNFLLMDGTNFLLMGT